jgi:hypothetical protein
MLHRNVLGLRRLETSFVSNLLYALLMTRFRDHSRPTLRRRSVTNEQPIGANLVIDPVPTPTGSGLATGPYSDLICG